jgi:hypothetical protein
MSVLGYLDTKKGLNGHYSTHVVASAIDIFIKDPSSVSFEADDEKKIKRAEAEFDRAHQILEDINNEQA